MRQQHAGRGDVDNGDPFFGCDGLEEIFAVRGSGRDARTLAARIARVQYIDRNVLLHRGQHRSRMQHLRPEVGQLGGLIEADDLDPPGIGAEVGVGRHHAVDVGPDFDALGVQSCADDGGGEV